MNGLIFIGLGVFLFVEFLQRVGLRKEGITGYVLACALVGLGITRIRAGWPRTDRSP